MPAKCSKCRRIKSDDHVCPEYECEHNGCNKIFNRKDDRRRHSYTHDRLITNEHCCLVCWQQFRTEETLKQHEKIHIIVFCDECGAECNARSISWHSCIPKKRGRRTITAKLTPETVITIKEAIESREYEQGKPTVKDIATLIQEQADELNLNIWRQSNNKKQSQAHSAAIKRFCNENDIALRSRTDIILPQNVQLTDLQILHRANTDEDVYNAMSDKDRQAIDSILIVESTTKEQENQTSKRKNKGSQNRAFDFTQKVRNKHMLTIEQNEWEKQKQKKKQSKKKKNQVVEIEIESDTSLSSFEQDENERDDEDIEQEQSEHSDVRSGYVGNGKEEMDMSESETGDDEEMADDLVDTVDDEEMADDAIDNVDDGLALEDMVICEICGCSEVPKNKYINPAVIGVWLKCVNCEGLVHWECEEDIGWMPVNNELAKCAICRKINNIDSD